MATVRAHAAASLEFVVPLAFAVAYIKVAFGNLGPALAGALVLLVTIAAFVSNLEVMGGRTVAGQVALYEPSDDVAAFIGTGLIITVAGSVTISTACFAAAMIIIHINISINHFSVLSGLFAVSTVLAQLSAFVGWCRLGSGDNVWRSLAIVGSNLSGLLIIFLLWFVHVQEPAAFAAPFLMRDGVAALISVAWLWRRSIRPTVRGWTSVLTHRDTAMKAFLLSIVTAFFEPLLKIYIVTAVGIASVPAFELLIRVISAARNGLVVFLQTYTSKLVDVGRSASETVKTLDWVAALTMFFALGAGGSAFYVAADFIVPGSRETIGPAFLGLIPAVVWHAAVVPRYIWMMVTGRVGRLIFIHLAQGFAPVIMLFNVTKGGSSSAVVALALSFILGGSTTFYLTRTRAGAFGDVKGLGTVITGAVFPVCLFGWWIGSVVPFSVVAIIISALSLTSLPLLYRFYRKSLDV